MEPFKNSPSFLLTRAFQLDQKTFIILGTVVLSKQVKTRDAKNMTTFFRACFTADCFKVSPASLFVDTTMSLAEFAERGKKTGEVGRFLCSNHENNTQNLYGCLVALSV